MIKKKKKSIALRLRNYFFTGVIVLIPIGFTLYLSKFLINFSAKLVPSGLNPNTYLPYSIPGIEILLTVFFITIVGGLSLSFLGKKFLQIVDDLFKRIPILRTIYSALGQMTDSFRNQENSKKSTQRAAIKALFRFLVVDFDIKLFYKCFRKVSLYNFIYGLGSFINSKLIIK